MSNWVISLGSKLRFSFTSLQLDPYLSSMTAHNNLTLGSQVLAVWCSGNHKQDPFSPVPSEGLFGETFRAAGERRDREILRSLSNR